MPDPKSSQPKCLSVADATTKLRACLKQLIGEPADDIDLDTPISVALPDASDGSLQALLQCIKDKTGWKLDPRDFGGSLQDIVDKLACVGGGS